MPAQTIGTSPLIVGVERAMNGGAQFKGLGVRSVRSCGGFEEVGIRVERANDLRTRRCVSLKTSFR